MTKLTNSIANAISRHPILFQNRTDVLHHYFCVIGNGMYWKNGELKYDFATYPTPRVYNEKAMLKEFASMYAETKKKYKDEYEKIKSTHLLDYRRAKMNADFNVANAKLLAIYPWTKTSYRWVYPLSDHSRMSNVPDNVKSDWLEGVREMIFAVFDTPESCYTARENWTAEYQKNSNDKLADTVLQSLHTRFGPSKVYCSSLSQYKKNKRDAKLMMKKFLTKIGK